MQQFALSVDTQLVQNDPRNDTQEGTIYGFMYSNAKFRGPNRKELSRKRSYVPKVTKVEQQMEGTGKVIDGG